MEWSTLNHRVSIIRKRHISQNGCFSLSSTKTQSSSGFQRSQRVLWLWQTWKYHWPVLAIKKEKRKKKRKNSATWSYQKLLEPGLKLKIQLLAEFCPTSMWHKICWYPWRVGKSVLQINDTKELKTQSAKCQGPVETSTWNVYTPCHTFNQYVAQREHEFHMDLFNMPIHLKITLPLWQTNSNPSTGGICISNWAALC